MASVLAEEPFEGVSRPVPTRRLLALDVLRGLTVAAMILVTDPGTYNARYAPLCHADWNGPTATDIIFPAFLVTVGVSLVLSFSARLGRGVSYAALAGHTLRRGLWLVLLGLALNGFPFYRLRTLPIPGILQLIAGAYVPAAFFYLLLRRAALRPLQRAVVLAGAAALALAIYWALLKLYPTPGFGPGRLDTMGSITAFVDRAVFTPAHMWAYGLTPGHGVTYDPNGLLLVLPTLATVLFGAVGAEILRAPLPLRRQCGALASLGTVLWLLGLSLSSWMVLNKKLWTPTFAMFSSGLALLALAGLLRLIDLGRVRRGWTLALLFGTNAIFTFVLSTVITTLLIVVHVPLHGQSTGLHTVIYDKLFALAAAPKLGSLMYALFIVLLNAALVYPLYRRRIFLRL